MKRFLGLVVVCGAASCVAVNAAAPTSATKKTVPAMHHVMRQSAAAREAAREAAILQLAPADEYFGPFKLSIIGIRNTIKDLGLRYDVNHDRAVQTYDSAIFVDRAIRDWEKRYPRDDQVPRAIYYLQRLYTKVLSQQSRDHAHVVAVWLFTDYAKSGQSKQLKKTLAVEKLAPVLPPIAATSAPSASQYQSAFGSGYPSAFAAGAPAPAASPADRKPATP